MLVDVTYILGVDSLSILSIHRSFQKPDPFSQNTATATAILRVERHTSKGNASNWVLGMDSRWVWLKIKQEGLRRFWSMCPLTRVPLRYRFFEPQPDDIGHSHIGRLKILCFFPVRTR